MEPCLPGEVLEAALVEGARKRKKSAQAKAGLACDANFPLIYDGPRDPKKLWQDEAFRLRTSVQVQGKRLMRTRPQFKSWAADVKVRYAESLPNEADLRDILRLVGEIIGLGDWRPKFGRFTVG